MQWKGIIGTLIVALGLQGPCAEAFTPVDHEVTCSAVGGHDCGDESPCAPDCGCHCCHGPMVPTCAFCLGELTFFTSCPSDKPFRYFERVAFSIWDPPRSV